jgi:hypothetical protein
MNAIGLSRLSLRERTSFRGAKGNIVRCLAIAHGYLATAIVACFLSVLSVAADNPPREAPSEVRLATWVGDDVGLCLQFDHLADQWSVFAESRLHEGIVRFPPVASALAQHRQQLSLLSAEIERRTGLKLRDIGKKVLGRQALFAIWPPANPLTDKPIALLLAESTDGELMRGSLEKLVAVRREEGRWRGRHTLSLGGDTYSIEVVASDDEQSEFFVTSVENIAVIATSESAVRQVLDRRAAGPEQTSLAASPAYRRAERRLAPGDAVRLFINPRAWDAALDADLKRKAPGSEEARSQAMIVAAWRATEYVCGGVQLTPDLAVELAWKWQRADLPEPVREVAVSLAGRALFLENLPDDALIAFAGHFELARLIRYSIKRGWQESPAAEGTSQQENTVLWALSAGLGADWGGYLKLRSGDDGSSAVDVVVGLQTRPLEAGSDRPPLAETIEPVLHALLSAAVESVNRQSNSDAAAIRSTGDHGRRITTVVGIVPDRPRQELAYCVDQLGRFWFGTSAAAIEQASQVRPDDNQAPDDAGSVLRVNLAQWRELAATGPGALDFFWEGKALDAQAKEQQYQSILAISRIADRLTLALRVDESTVHLSYVIMAEEQ